MRPRRLRQNRIIRSMVKETTLLSSDLILPLFIHDQVESVEISSMPGHFRWDAISILKQCESALKKGIKCIALFPSIDPSKKTSDCLEALNEENLLCTISRRVKKAFGDDIMIVGDIALDPYSSDGHDGLVKDGIVLNDETVDMLSKMAVIQADAGIDILAPSDMMDGRVAAIRFALDEHDFQEKIIMSYTAKYASNFYGPFRDALDSAPRTGDKKTYQMNFSNRVDASLELDLDVAEGADIVMVKPAGHYLDIISDYRSLTNLPVAAYHVSGEYAMLKAADKMGVLDFNSALYEVLTSIKRAGASLILTYGAIEIIDFLEANPGL
ncbi:MAG: porphobilinogen synthase [Candidatus Margulisiibacteriota bacterium]